MSTCAQHPDRPAAGTCTRCDRAVCEECDRKLDGRSYCPECLEFLERRLAERAAAIPPPPPPGASDAPLAPAVASGPPPGLLRPLVFAALAGVAGAFAWYLAVVSTDYKVGLVAAGIGWLVGFAAVRGAGGRGWPVLAFASLGVALGAMFLGEYLIVNHYVLQELAGEDPNAELPRLIPFGLFTEIYPETVGAMDVLFYGFGAYEAWKLPAGRAE